MKTYEIEMVEQVRSTVTVCAESADEAARLAENPDNWQERMEQGVLSRELEVARCIDG